MREYKILFTGAMGSGKTAAIATLSEIEPLKTEVAATTPGRPEKTTTTVGLDYGEITISPGCKLRLFGTPGQGRYRFLWDVLREGVLGVIILVDHGQPDAAARLEGFLDEFADTLKSVAGAVGVTHSDLAPERPFDPYFEIIERRDLRLPVLPIDARQPEDVLALVDAVLSMVESDVYKEVAAGAGAQ